MKMFVGDDLPSASRKERKNAFYDAKFSQMSFVRLLLLPFGADLMVTSSSSSPLVTSL